MYVPSVTVGPFGVKRTVVAVVRGASSSPPTILPAFTFASHQTRISLYFASICAFGWLSHASSLLMNIKRYFGIVPLLLVLVLDDRPHFDARLRGPGLRDLERGIDARDVHDDEAADDLLRLDERTVGH